MTGDVDVVVEHAAPVLARGRRGALPTLGLAPVRTPARIRHVRPSAMEARLHPGGAWAGGHDQAGLAVFEGRLWRRLLLTSGATGGYPNRVSMTPEDLARHLADGASARGTYRRTHLATLALAPLIPTGSSGRLADVPAAEPDPDRLILDLRAEAASSMAARVAGDLLHDGTQSWIALAPPLVTRQDGGKAWIVGFQPTGMLPDLPGTLPGDVGHYLDYLGRSSASGRLGRGLAEGIRETAATLRADLSGYAPPPLSDVARCLRLLTLSTAAAAATAAAGGREAAEAAAPHLAGLLPFHARAAADLLAPGDLHELVERLQACAGAALAGRAGPRERKTPAVKSLTRAVHYLDAVARPRLSAAMPDADVESLGALAP